MRKTVIASKPNPTEKDKEALKAWEHKYRNRGYGTVRVLAALKRSGVNLEDFKVRSSSSKYTGSKTEISYRGYSHDSRVHLVSKIPALVANGMEVTIMIKDNKIATFLFKALNESADQEIKVWGQEPGAFTFWSIDEKNEHGRDLFLQFKGAHAVEKAKYYCSKFEVR